MRLNPWLSLPLLALATLALRPGPAEAWWRGGLFFGFPAVAPFYYAPPPVVYAPPPMVYAPPPAAYGPPAGYYPPPGQPPAQPQQGEGMAGPACHAGAYVCPLDRPAAPGAPCSCPTNTGRIGGQVG